MPEYNGSLPRFDFLAATLVVVADTLEEHGTESEIIVAPHLPERVVQPTLEVIRNLAVILQVWHDALAEPVEREPTEPDPAESVPLAIGPHLVQ